MSNLDWYLYLRTLNHHEYYRVNVSKLVCENSRPQLERQHIIYDDEDLDYDEDDVLDVGYLFKDSVTNTIHRLECSRYCCKFATTIDTKLYLLVNSPTDDYSNGRRIQTSLDVFKVYDPFHGLWKILPSPPISDTHPRYVYEHFEWGHMLGVFDRHCEGAPYVFDTIEEKWMPAVGLPRLVCAVEFSGFLIGIDFDSRYKSNGLLIVAYKLDDENGLPDSNSKHTLDGDLWEIFYPPLGREGMYHLTRFGDDHVIFCCGVDYHSSCVILFAVFRVSVSTVGGLPIVRASFEHKQLYRVPDCGYSHICSTFLMQNAPNNRTHMHIGSLQHIMLDDQPAQVEARRTRRRRRRNQQQQKKENQQQQEKELDHHVAQTFDNNKLMADVDWDAGVLEKSLYLCFVENRTDCSVSYIIKAIKFSDLISTSSHDSKSILSQVASTSGFHLALLPCCGVFGSLILFAGGGDQDFLRLVQPPVEDDCYSDPGCDVVEEVAQHIPNSRDIHFYDMTASNDPKSYSNIKRFTKSFKGLKPQPVLAEVEGKLYALAGSPKPKYTNPSPFFEVYDPREKEWSPLPDPPSYTNFISSRSCLAIAGTNILAWGDNESPGVFRFDMAADSIDKDWRLMKNSRVLTNPPLSKYATRTHQSSIVVDNDSNGGGDFVLFTYEKDWLRRHADLQVHLISRELDNVVRLPSLNLPESVSSFLNRNNGHSSFVHLGGRRVCLVLSSTFEGPYSRTVFQLGEADKMSIDILVFEFEVTRNRESVAAEFVFQHTLEYDTNSDAKRNSKTSDAHLVGAFLL